MIEEIGPFQQKCAQPYRNYRTGLHFSFTAAVANHRNTCQCELHGTQLSEAISYFTAAMTPKQLKLKFVRQCTVDTEAIHPHCVKRMEKKDFTNYLHLESKGM